MPVIAHTTAAWARVTGEATPATKPTAKTEVPKRWDWIDIWPSSLVLSLLAPATGCASEARLIYKARKIIERPPRPPGRLGCRRALCQAARPRAAGTRGRGSAGPAARQAPTPRLRADPLNSRSERRIKIRSAEN